MKRKRVERIERRRALVEINLIGDSRSRPAAIGRRGCMSLISRNAALAVVLAALIAAHLGLH